MNANLKKFTTPALMRLIDQPIELLSVETGGERNIISRYPENGIMVIGRTSRGDREELFLTRSGRFVEFASLVRDEASGVRKTERQFRKILSHQERQDDWISDTAILAVLNDTLTKKIYRAQQKAQILTHQKSQISRLLERAMKESSVGT